MKNAETDSEPSSDEESISSEQKRTNKEQRKNDDKSKDQEDNYNECAQKEVDTNKGNTTEENVVDPIIEDGIDDDDGNRT